MAFSTKEELISRIERLFPTGLYEGPMTTCSCSECKQLDRDVRAKPWQEFTPDEVFGMHAGTTLLEEEAYWFFAPAYMRAALVAPEAADMATDFFAWGYLREHGDDEPFHLPHPLSPEQRGVLYDWLDRYVSTIQETVDDDLERCAALSEEDAAHLRRFIEEDMAKIALYQSQIGKLRTKFPANDEPSQTVSQPRE